MTISEGRFSAADLAHCTVLRRRDALILLEHAVECRDAAEPCAAGNLRHGKISLAQQLPAEHDTLAKEEFIKTHPRILIEDAGEVILAVAGICCHTVKRQLLAAVLGDIRVDIQQCFVHVLSPVALVRFLTFYQPARNMDQEQIDPGTDGSRFHDLPLIMLGYCPEQVIDRGIQDLSIGLRAQMNARIEEMLHCGQAVSHVDHFMIHHEDVACTFRRSKDLMHDAGRDHKNFARLHLIAVIVNDCRIAFRDRQDDLKLAVPVSGIIIRFIVRIDADRAVIMMIQLPQACKRPFHIPFSSRISSDQIILFRRMLVKQRLFFKRPLYIIKQTEALEGCIMEMTLRWYGTGFDTVTLRQIRQIPGVTGVISTLYDTAPGEVWPRERIHALKEEIEAAGLHLSGIESVNVHDAIKVGSPDREQYIDNYIETLANLGREDIHLVCYNFMPVFDWTRTELARRRPDGSTVLAYTQAAVDKLDPEKMFESIAGDANGAILPGWEPERMARVKELFEMYSGIDNEKLFANLCYFLRRIMPVCNEYDIRMAIHPDDPAWSVFGLPRIIINQENILRMMHAVDDVHNGVTFCSGSYGTNLENDLPGMIRALKGRIHFAHVRNLKFNSPDDFEESAHLSSDGMYEIMRALYETGFNGPIRPDHGRMIWDEVAMPGYGLYDRALGAAYLNGLWEAIDKAAKRGRPKC